MISHPVAPWILGELLGEEFGSAWYRARFGGEDVLVRVFDGAYDAELIAMRIAEDGWLGKELRHPGLLAILATDRLAYAIPYFEGWTVRSLLPLSVPAALAVALATCDVLHYLLTHPKGPVLHRRLDLDSIFVDSAGVVQLLEPTLHRLDPGPGEGAILPPKDLMYLSPEAVRGHALGVADQVFRVGVLLHAMVTGQSPFQRTTALDTVLAIRDGEARLDPRLAGLRTPGDPPGQTVYRSPGKAPVAVELGQVILRAIAREPGDRFASMAELRGALAALEAEPSSGGRSMLLGEARASRVASRPAPFLPMP